MKNTDKLSAIIIAICTFLFAICFTLEILAQNSASNLRETQQEPEALPEVMAEVNGDKIMKLQLANECLRQHGTSELENLIKKTMILGECNRLKITVSQEEINEEIARMAKAVGISTEAWLELYQKELKLTPVRYMQDVIFPILALRKMGGQFLNVSEEEISKEYDSRFGAGVQVRQIVLGSRKDAEKVLEDVKKNPEAFPSIAKNVSIDPASQPYGGLLQPIRTGTLENPPLETMLLSMKPGDISQVIELMEGYFVIYKCEQHFEPQNVDREKIREQIVMKIRDLKTRKVTEQVLKNVQERTKVQILFGNPIEMGRMPGVAAIVNDKKIMMDELGDTCIEHYGADILEEMINKLLVEQACRRNNIVVTDADIDNEIREMAIKSLPLLESGQPNVQLWMKMATEESRIPPQVYRTNTIWPVLALKRLSRNMVEVTEEDVKRSFEANFGRKVRCLAIAFETKDQRRAQEVWAMANQHKTAENFGDLAEKYSADPDNRMARGVIPPISRFCGQPAIEREAFGLLPNELSQIIQVDDSLVILYCLGFEEPTITDIEDVKADLIADIFEKKQKIAVAKYFENLTTQAVIDNYLTGESRNPQLEKAIQEQSMKN